MELASRESRLWSSNISGWRACTREPARLALICIFALRSWFSQFCAFRWQWHSSCLLSDIHAFQVCCKWFGHRSKAGAALKRSFSGGKKVCGKSTSAGLIFNLAVKNKCCPSTDWNAKLFSCKQIKTFLFPKFRWRQIALWWWWRCLYPWKCILISERRLFAPRLKGHVRYFLTFIAFVSCDLRESTLKCTWSGFAYHTQVDNGPSAKRQKVGRFPVLKRK